MLCLKKISFILLFFYYTIPFFSQESIKGVDLVTKLIESDSIDKAEIEINKQIAFFKNQQNYDTLCHYIYPLGKINLLKKKSEGNSILLAKELTNKTSNKSSLYTLNMQLSKLFFDKEKLQEAYTYAEKAKSFALMLKNKEFILNTEYHLGDYGMRMGELSLLEKHIREGELIIKSSPEASYSITARVYNLMGGVMFFTSKQDSAIYYFEKALKNIPLLEKNLENQLYLPAAIKGNLSMIHLNNGEYQKAKKIFEECFVLNKEFLVNAPPNHALIKHVKRNLSIGYGDLASLYFDLGDFKNAGEIIQLGYNFTKENFDANSEPFFNSVMNLIDVKIAQREFKMAFEYLDEAKKCLSKMAGQNFEQYANLNSRYGSAYYAINQPEEALKHFELCDFYYEKSNPGKYSANRFYVTMNLAITYSKLNKKDKATTLATKLYNHAIKNEKQNDYLINDILLVLTTVNYNVKDYAQSIFWSSKSLDIYKKNNDERENNNKLHFEIDKAQLLVLNAKAKYQLKEQKSIFFLEELLSQVNKAITLLENQKSIISSLESVNTLIESNRDVFDFAKKINFELYQITSETKYLESVISLHESSVYNKIRVRLNLNNKISFLGVPKRISDRENTLRQKLNIGSEYAENNIETVQDIQIANKNWNVFLDSLKQSYPEYYKMRYATIAEPLKGIENSIPDNTTIIRYFFIEDELKVLLVNKNVKEIIPLDYKDSKTSIEKLMGKPSSVSETSTLLYKLYNTLWQPFNDKIDTNKVIIFPDRELYNLSFETLTPTKIISFNELATKSLLAKHTISYNYSLFLLNKSKQKKIYDNNFVAFAPEFNDKMKNEYQLAISDSLSLDKTYLALLRQPFNVDIAKTYSKLFDGNYFLNENSTAQIFKKNASEHKIIHVGTHAESNNISPELSRLIFAKNVSDSNTEEDNSLYAYEIYNTSLNSNLAILTACETGKPSYQAGEGMISLAHAFNYAGSESILTSLWEVDERSSAEIIKLFYDNIKRGQSKDEALMNAKLKYLKTADSRAIVPHFWAGLVLMGDASPITISQTSHWKWILLIVGILLVLLLFFKFKQK